MRIGSYKPYGVAFGAAIAVLGVAMIWGISQLPDTASYAAVGPKVFPQLVGGGMALTGLAVIREALAPSPPDETGGDYDLGPILLISAALVFAAIALDGLGWVITATIVFGATAWAFGERRLVATALIGLALAAAAYVFFNYVLRLNLPAGIVGF